MSGFFGGERGIRTPEGFDTLRAFQARALDHYATSPRRNRLYLRILLTQATAVSLLLLSPNFHRKILAVKFGDPHLPGYSTRNQVCYQ